jgi:ribosome recycling factor
MAVIKPYDMGAISATIEKAIRDSDLGVNPTNDGKMHPLCLPAADRGAPQGVHQGRPAKAEDGRVAVRNIRRKAKDELDRSRRTARPARTTSPRREGARGHLTDKYVAQVDEL